MNKSLVDIVSCMKQGGYYDRIMSGGDEYSRIQYYLQVMAGEKAARLGKPLQRPTYPVFPGIHSRPFHAASEFAGAIVLEERFPDIRREAEALFATDFLSYFPRGKLTADPEERIKSSWGINFLYYMGLSLDSSARCPETINIISCLPDVCLDYPWGDALFSVQAASSHLAAHCSIDGLRVRCHLGLSVPENCEIRVGRERRHWQEGRCLLFEDSFEHEVWNKSDQDRLILIVDFWHPEITLIEREALTAGFRKSEIRMLFYRDRIKNTDASQELVHSFALEFKRQDQEPLIQQYWN